MANSVDGVLYLVGPYKKRRHEVAPTPRPSSASSLPPTRLEDQERHDLESAVAAEDWYIRKSEKSQHCEYVYESVTARSF
jgi:hypothetical protein